MAVGIDSKIAALEDVATRLRINSIRATTAAGSGHPTSCASAADLVAAIFFDAMRFDPEHPRDPASDRFVLSKGHAAPVLYAAWTEVGTVKADDLLTLRALGSDLEGHPTPRLPFVDVATGSLGQGLSVGVGLALGARFVGTEARAYVLLGDGEMAEGSVWEAAAMASHQKLGSLVAVLDVNALGQSGPTMLRHDVKTYQKRFAAFGWRALAIEGHDMRAIVEALAKARRGKDAPTAIVARTIKGQGIDEVAGLEGWHGKALPKDLAERTITALEGRLHHVPAPVVTRPKRRRTPPGARVSPAPPPPALDAKPGSSAATRETYGEALVRLGAVDDKVLVMDGDVKNSTFAEKFLQAYPDRYIDAFIAEQNMLGVAGGLAAQGFVPFASSFACFLERAADQIRMLGISRSNVKLCGSHAGVSIGEDGPSQMALEDLALLRAVPEMVVFYPGDAVSTEACVRLAAEHRGMVYIRTTRPKTPILYAATEQFSIGGLKVVRAGDADRCTIVAAGITLHEALAAHEELAKTSIATRVIDLYCVKPVDAAGLKAAARATGHRILTVEDHYAEGGIGDAVLEAVGDAGVTVHRLAVREIPRSGPGQKLLEKYGIDRGAIARKVREIVG